MTIEAMTREHITDRHYRPLPAENPVSAKDIERERIARQTRAYLAGGGRVKRIPAGVGAEGFIPGQPVRQNRSQAVAAQKRRNRVIRDGVDSDS